MKISMDKKYRTRDGHDVRLLCVDGPGTFPVVGIADGCLETWDVDGSYNGNDLCVWDLIEYHEPDIRTIWVNVYDVGVASYKSEALALDNADVYGKSLAIAQPVTFEVKK